MKKLLLISLLAFFAISVKSQETSSLDSLLDMSLEELMDVRVSGVSRYKQSVADVPNSLHVISRQEIIDRGYFDLSDLLKDMSAFDMVSNAGQFGEFYGLRGIEGNDRFLVLVNGHKINPASGTHLSIGNSISIRYAERVEIIYGPASAVYGADAFSGIINIIYSEHSQKKEKTEIAANINYASLNTKDIGLKTTFQPGDDFSINFTGRLYLSDGPDYSDTPSPLYDYSLINDYPDPLKNEFEQPTNDYTIFFNTNYKNLSLNYFRKQFDEGNALGFIPDIYIYNKENRWKNSIDVVWLTYTIPVSENGSFVFDLSYKRFEQDNNTIYYKWNVPGDFNPNETYKQYMTGKDNTLHGLITYNQEISDKAQFIIGLDNEYSSMIPPYANDEALGESYRYEGEYKQIIDDSLTITENRFSGFGQLVYTPNKMLSLTLGARYDYSTRYEGIFNPRLGFVLSPFSSTKLKYIYGRAFQAPSLFFQYEQWGAPTIVNISASEIQRTQPDWKLENQIVNTHELSITQTLSENFSIKLAAYYNDLSNIIERNLYTNSVYNKYFDTYTPGLRNENIGVQKIIGSDVLLNAKLSRKVLMHTYYSYTNAESHRDENSITPVPRIANHKAWAGITAQNLFKRITVSTRFKWVGDVYNMNTELFPNNLQEGYYMLDAHFVVNNIFQNLRIYASFENILNQYIEHGGLYEQTGVYTAVIPQQGFTFRVGAEFWLTK